MIGVREALVSSSAGAFSLSRDVLVPALSPGTMLCKVFAVALNPADAKISDYSPSVGSIAGLDFAGEVIQIGPSVTARQFKPGDRIFGIANGQNPDDKATGAFANYVLATADLACKIPDGMTFEQAATLGVAVETAGLSLFHFLGLPMPDETYKSQPSKERYVLVSGGATSTGILAIQFLKLAGFQPIATCSPGSNDRVRSLGAVTTFDYHSPTCGMDVRTYTQNALVHALDCVTSTETMRMCYEAIGSGGGFYLGLDPISTKVAYTRRDVYANWVVAVSGFGVPIKFAGVYGRPAMPEHREISARIFKLVEKLLDQDKLIGPKFQVQSGGLAAVEEGIEEIRKGRVKGVKLVYTLA